MHRARAHRAGATGSTVSGPLAAGIGLSSAVIGHTAVFIDRAIDATLRELVQDWDEVFDATPAAATGDQPMAGTTDVVAAVAHVGRVLGVPEVDVLAAAGISARTYYSWKAEHRTPRLASVGKLWLVVQMTEDLAALGDSALVWFRRDPAHRQLLRNGQTDELLRRYSDERLRAAAPVTAPVIAAGFVGPEVTYNRMSEPHIPARARVTPRGFTR